MATQLILLKRVENFRLLTSPDKTVTRSPNGDKVDLGRVYDEYQ